VEWLDHGEAEVTGRRKKGAAVLEVLGATQELGLGFRWVGAALCRAAAVPLTCGPEARELAGDLGGGRYAGEERRKGEGGR
jgi:hypothetical protein